jgi:hypothetical protein
MEKKNTGAPVTPTGLRDKINNNVVIILIASGVAVASVTAGVTHYLSKQQQDLMITRHETAVQNLLAEHRHDVRSLATKHDDELAELATRLRSIERRLGGNDFFDVKQFFVDDARELQLSKEAEFHNDAGFYAPKGDTRWQYVTMSEMEFARYVMGPQNPLLELVEQMAPQSEDFGTVHIWKGTDEKLVDGLSPVQRVFPYISVERIGYEDLFGEINKMTEFLADQLVAGRLENAELSAGDRELFVDFADAYTAKLFRGDAVGALLPSYLFMSQMITNMYPNVHWYVKNLQKAGNVVYLQSITTLSDVAIAGEHHDNYFLTGEIIMISTQDAIYIVQTNVPNHEPAPRNEYFVWVNEWLGDFAVVVR